MFSPQGAVKQDRLLGNQRYGAARRLCLSDGSDVLTVHQDAARVHVVKALQELHQRRLAGSRFPHERHLLTGSDAQVEVPEHRLRLVGVAEPYGLEADGPRSRHQSRRAGGIRHLRKRAVDVHQVVELVGGALQVAHLAADVAELAVDDEVGGEDEHQIGQPPVARLRQGQNDGQQAAEERDDHDRLHRARIHAAPPGAARPCLPVGGHGVQPLVFTPLGAERLDHRVAGDRVGQRTRRGPGVRIVGLLIGGRHVRRDKATLTPMKIHTARAK